MTTTTMSPTRATQDVSYQCRLLGHAWNVYVPEDFSRLGVWRNALHLKCLRCTMARHDAFESNGTLATRKYDPPEGYYLKGAEEKPTTEELRLWVLKRQRRLASSNERTST